MDKPQAPAVGVDALRALLQRVLDEHDFIAPAGLACPSCERHADKSNPLCLIHSIRAALASAEGNSPSLEMEALDALDAVFQELDSCSANDGERTGDEFRFGHRCVICDRNVDRNSVLRDRIRAVLRRGGR